ncbi:GL16843 [Drosophila persimilis]|uniref:GL16843 n=1 Tax=Drosophila persimilis TaxID=7234 RepID=B4GI05_DROPE|nr:GL16843 [Drosophila persimilis]
MADNTARDAAGLESSLDFSIVQQNENENAEGYTQITGSSNDLSLLQNVSTSTTIGGGGGRGKGRLDSLKENLSKQQERLMALRERAQRRPSKSESMESLKTLGQKLTVLKARSGGIAVSDASTPLATPTKEKKDDSLNISLLQPSGSEKVLMLTQRTEQNRALLEQRKRDMAKSLLSVRSGLSQSYSHSHSHTNADLGSSMTDLRQAMAPEANAPVSRHRSALDLQQQQQQADEMDENRMKLLKNRMKITELKQSRQEQEMLELRQELARRASLIEQLELSGAELQRTLTRRDEELEQMRADVVLESKQLARTGVL